MEVKEEGFWDDLAIEDISKDLKVAKLGKRKADGDLTNLYIDFPKTMGRRRVLHQ